MAEAALIGAAKSVLPKLGDLALTEAISCWSARGDLEDLGETMEMIEAVLRDAEEQQDSNHAVKLWLQRLRRALYEADDLFDEVLARDQSRKLVGTLNKVRGLFSASNPVWLSWNVAGKIRSVRQKLDKVTDDMKQFNFRIDQADGAGLKLGGWYETSPHVVEIDIIGREADKQNILRMLCGVEESRDTPDVVAIVGVGGLGKTTLAQLVYNDNIVSGSFELKAWACIYDETNRRNFIEGRILKSIFQSCKVQPDGKPELEANFIRSIFSDKYDELDINKIRSSIGELLEGKKYFLVLDDVWDDNRNSWVDLFGVLRKGKKESKVVITTRSESVARVMGVHMSRLFNLGDLETKEAERLFNRFALRSEWVGDSGRTGIGRKIFIVCPKIPLLLRSIGSMLYSMGSLSEWESVKNAMPQLMTLDEGEISIVVRVLKISYDHLCPHLKRCFAYCALFPKDHEFDKEYLIRLWVAQGFVQPSIARLESLEDVGHKYFTELLNKSFFLIGHKVDEYGRTMLCHKMHDIMHDLALYVAREEVDVISDCCENMQRASDLRHVALNVVSPNSLKFGAARQVRSIFISEILYIPTECVEMVCINFASLRVLDLHGLGILHVPDSLGELIHLRFLDLSKNEYMAYLPNSLTRLINLQTLNLYFCRSLKELPKRFSRLINLRHLNLFWCINLSHMPPGFEQLKSLQTFEGYFVVNEPKNGPGKYIRSSGLNAFFGLNIFCKKLEIKCDGRGVNIMPMEKEADELDSKLSNSINEVNDLYITFEWGNQLEAHFGMMTNLQRLKIQNLQKLRIREYEGERFPGWGRDRSMTIPPLFNNLIEIEISSFANCKILPSFSMLPYLKVLSLKYLDGLEYIEEYPAPMSSTPPLSFFPSLEKLELVCLYEVEGWFRFSNSVSSPSREPSINTMTWEAQHAFTLPSFPCVCILIISYCNRLTTIPPLLPDDLQQVELIRVQLCLGAQLLSKLASPILLSSSDLSSLCTFKATPESFDIYNFRNLFSLSFVDRVSNSIKKLNIRDCPELCSFKGLESQTSLQELEIYNCKALDLWEEDSSTTLTPWQLLSNNCKSLRVLSFCGPSKWGTLPSGIKLLATLREMQIKYLDHLKALPEWIGNLIHLQKLYIQACPQLSHLRGLEFLTSLQHLQIDNCEALDLWPNCKSLRVLQLYDSKLESLPSGLQFLTNLQELLIEFWINMNAIPEWIGNLTHLKKLAIWESPKLTCLPKSMLNLTVLQRLVIRRCGETIVEKCKETTGQYWPLIQRIPDRDIRL